jgi:hypothetical protein
MMDTPDGCPKDPEPQKPTAEQKIEWYKKTIAILQMKLQMERERREDNLEHISDILLTPEACPAESALEVLKFITTAFSNMDERDELEQAVQEAVQNAENKTRECQCQRESAPAEPSASPGAN